MQLQQFRVKKRRNNFLCVSLRQTGRILAHTQDYPEKKNTERKYSHMVSESCSRKINK